MIDLVARFLKQRIGLDVESIGECTLQRVLKQRAQVCNLAEGEPYLNYLLNSSDELQALVEAVVVGETWFFRYPLSFSALQQLALQKRRTTNVLRVLSLPCSTGEEPYSIAMSLMSAGLAPREFAIDALDVSEQALLQAKAGIYGRNAFRGNELGFRRQYFHKTGQGYVLDEAVKSSVRLQVGNLLEPKLLLQLPQYDVVFCRNLLIYFDRATQLRALDVLKRLTAEAGVLFIGPAEASLFSAAGLTPLGFSQAFAFSHKPAVAPTANAIAPARLNKALAPPQMPLPAPVKVGFAKVKARINHEASVSVPDLIQGLKEVQVLADQNLHQKAQAKAQELLNVHGVHSEIFYWQALLAEVQGDVLSAQQLYRKVLYLEPQHVQAIAHLATLLAAQGEHVAAQRIQQRAQQGVKRGE